MNKVYLSNLSSKDQCMYIFGIVIVMSTTSTNAKMDMQSLCICFIEQMVSVHKHKNTKNVCN